MNVRIHTIAGMVRCMQVRPFAPSGWLALCLPGIHLFMPAACRVYVCGRWDHDWVISKALCNDTERRRKRKRRHRRAQHKTFVVGFILVNARCVSSDRSSVDASAEWVCKRACMWCECLCGCVCVCSRQLNAQKHVKLWHVVCVHLCVCAFVCSRNIPQHISWTHKRILNLNH